MKLVTQAQFAKMAGVSAVSIHKALKAGKNGPARLEFYAGTRKIDADSSLAQQYLRHPSDQRIVAASPAELSHLSDKERNDALSKAATDVQKAQKAKILEDKGFKEAKRIEIEFKNAVRRGEYVSIEAINKTIMIFLDRWLNENERIFSAKYEEIERNIVSDSKDRSKNKQDFIDLLRERAHFAKTTTCDYLKSIVEKQSKV